MYSRAGLKELAKAYTRAAKQQIVHAAQTSGLKPQDVVALISEHSKFPQRAEARTVRRHGHKIVSWPCGTEFQSDGYYTINSFGQHVYTGWLAALPKRLAVMGKREISDYLETLVLRGKKIQSAEFSEDQGEVKPGDRVGLILNKNIRGFATWQASKW